MQAGCNSVLYSKSDDFIPQWVKDRVQWSGAKTLNKSELMMREIFKHLSSEIYDRLAEF